MLREKYVSYYMTNIILDAGVAVLSLVIAYLLRSYVVDMVLLYDVPIVIHEIYSFDRFLWLIFIMVPLWPILMDMNGAYSSLKFANLKAISWIIFKSVSIGTALIILFMFAAKIEGISRLFIFMISGVSFFLLLLKEFLFRLFALSKKRNDYAFRNILIIGDKKDATVVIKALKGYSFWGLKVFGIIDISEGNIADKKIEGINIMGGLKHISEIIVKYPIDEVLIASAISTDAIQAILEECEELGIKSRISLNYYDLKIAKPSIESFHDIPILTFSSTPMKVLDLFVKYAFDRVIAFFLLMLLSPVFLVIAVAIKLTSKGPVVFFQTRVGLYGRPFKFYKFRSMYDNAEERLKELQKYNEMEGPVFKMKDDPRITSIGKFLRRSSLDELPQLWNVFKGEMSLVGPRPPIPQEVEKYERWQRRKLSMKPGLTCIWQVSGRNQIVEFDDWMRMDLEYIDNWSLLLDFKLLVKTFFVVLSMSGAH